jgi:predicted nucleotidyltransferase
MQWKHRQRYMRRKKIKYPAGPQFVSLKYYPSLKANWDYSYDKLVKLNNRITEEINYDHVSIAVAGSYGRLDASTESDLDYMILSDQEDKEVVKRIRDILKKICQELGIKDPNPAGVFADVIPIPEMIDKTGSKDDTISSLAHRMLLLMEAKPLYNESLYTNLIERLLEKYLVLLTDEPSKEALFLINDIIRYFRTICVNYEFNFWREEDKWVIRNVKLRHSRIIMYAGLLLLVLNASKHYQLEKSKRNYIRPLISLTPLEKIAHVYQDNNDRSLSRVFSIYEVFLRKISDPKIRNSLRIEYEQRHNNPDYLELKVTSDALQTELTRFIFAQRGRWTEQVFEYLIF